MILMDYRKIDPLGRIVIPKKLRDALALRPEDFMVLSLMSDGSVLMRRANPQCVVCGSIYDLVLIRSAADGAVDVRLCKACRGSLMDASQCSPSPSSWTSSRSSPD